jgi:cell division septation protein DedD
VLKKNPEIKDDMHTGGTRWKWVVVSALGITLGVAALMFATPTTKAPIHAQAPTSTPVRAKISMPVPVETLPDPEAQDFSAPAGEAADQAADEPPEEETGLVQVASGAPVPVETDSEPLAAQDAADFNKSDAPPPATADLKADLQPPAGPVAEPPQPLTDPKTDGLAKAPAAGSTNAGVLTRIGSVAAVASEQQRVQTRQEFTIQVGAFRRKANADGMYKVLYDLGYDPFIFQLELDDQDVLYMVRFGGFATRTSAEAAMIEFKQKEKMEAVVAQSGRI